jgi:hypothetical protein
MSLHEIDLEKFIKIYILYCTLSYFTIYRKVEGGADKGGNANKHDFSKIHLEGAGVDLYTLVNQGFPQLKSEN